MTPAASPLSVRNFRWLWTGSIFSYMGQWIQQATLGWVVYDITGSGALLGAVLGSRAIPILLFSPLAGVAADRYERRSLLLLSQLMAAAAAFVFGAALAWGALAAWHLFAFVFAFVFATVIDRPARLTTVLDVVPRELTMKAVALNSIGHSTSRIVGPSIAGFLIAWLGPAGNFAIQGVVYIAAAAMVLLISFPPRKPGARKLSAWTDLTEGVRYAASDPPMRLMLTLGMIAFFLMAPAGVAVLPVFAKDVFAAGPEGLGLMLTAAGIGGILGGIASSYLTRVDRQGWVQAAGLLGMALALLGLAVSPTLAVALVFLALEGGAEMMMITSNQTMLQICSPEAMRGRIAGLIQLYPAVVSVGSILCGVLVDLAGARGATAWMAGATGLLIAAMLAASPRLRALRMSDYRQARAQDVKAT